MITKRKVYFLSGFDPRGAAFYHRLFREESKKQSRLNGSKVITEKRKRNDALFNSWEISSQWGSASVTTDYRFLCWDVIIRENWIESFPDLIKKALAMYLLDIKNGLFKKFKAVAKSPFVSSILPLVFLIVSLSIALCIAAGSGLALYTLIGNQITSYTISILIFVTLMYWAKKLGDKLGVWWILQTYLFLSTWGKKENSSLKICLEQFAQLIITDDQESPADEILLIGHCVGALLSVSVMAQIIKQNQPSLAGKLKLITIGQCIPYVSYQTTATKFRQDLTSVVENKEFPWVDFGARIDPLCFAQADPAYAHGMPIKERLWPTRFTVKPYNMFSPPAYETLKKSRLRLHFQYLMSSDLLTDYDYFRITTGSEILEVSEKNMQSAYQ